MRTPIVDGRSIEQFIPANLRGMFYKNAIPQYKYAIHNGYDPYGFSTDGLVLYLPLWALKGNTFKSVDAYRHMATVNGALWRPDGRIFAGGVYIDITPALTNALAATTTGTIGFWVKVPDATPGGQMAFVAFGDTDGNEYLRLFIEQAGKFQCNAAIAGVASWSLETDNAVFSDNVWAYVELIHDGTNASARINGVAVAQTLTEHDDLTAWFGGLTGLDNGFIGKSSFNNNANLNPLAATIGEVIIHNQALSAAEGLHNYNRTKLKYQ